MTTEIIGVGNIGGSARIEAPLGDLHQGGMNSKLVDIDRARAAVATAKAAS